MVGKIIDYAVAVSIFTVTVAFVAMLSLNYVASPYGDVVTSELRSELFRMNELLIKSAGEPHNWQLSSPQVIGLARHDRLRNETLEYALQEEKVQRLNSSTTSALSYAAAKSALGMGKDFNITLESPFYDWLNTSFRFRLPLLMNASPPQNASVVVEFPRAHAYAGTLVVANATGSNFTAYLASVQYYDPPYNRWLKKANLTFSATAGSGTRFYLYYADSNITSQSYSPLSATTQNVTAGEEEAWGYATYGRENLAQKSEAVSERTVAIVEDVAKLAYIGTNSYEQTLLKKLGYGFDAYDDTNISQLFNTSNARNLFTYGVVIVGTHATDSANVRNNLSSNGWNISNWSYAGGGLVVFGQELNTSIDGYAWLAPLGINGSNGSGSAQVIVDETLRILNYPNNLTARNAANESIYLSTDANSTNNHPSAPASGTYWTWPKLINFTLYNSSYWVTKNASVLYNDTLIYNGEFTGSATGWTPSAGTNVTCDWTDGGWAGSGVVYCETNNFPDTNSWGNWSQSWYYDGRVPPDAANLSFSWYIRDFGGGALGSQTSTMYVFITAPDGAENVVWKADYSDNDRIWRTEYVDIGKAITRTGVYTIKLAINLKTGSADGRNRAVWDNIALNISYSPIIWLAGEYGVGKVTVTGDEPYYTGHDAMVENAIEWAYPAKRMQGHLYKLRTRVWQ